MARIGNLPVIEGVNAKTLWVIPSRIDAPLNMDKWVKPLCTPRPSRFFIILTDIPSAECKGYSQIYPQGYPQQSYTRLYKQSSAGYSPTLPVSHCPVTRHVPPCSPLPAGLFPITKIIGSFDGRLEMVNRVDVTGPGGGGVSCGVGAIYK